ncbi:MAG: quinone-dependent dihydroorotate dehydrogenase [Nevskiaceae bacterium]|nr:MAG: quinone-dependent dihydroorotate dehydrogenase [Nevskiaceae bacterium]TBR71513.1 MAG: quinone-dependent dihydroorotate dehydrogenase [Nevskiaceae bacterium]
MTVYDLARAALFQLDAERSHDLTLALLARFPRLATAPFAPVVDGAPVELMGLRFRNRVGLAAGLDKDGRAILAFDRLGFGFIEVGTVTPRPQPGNPKPRMFRLVQDGALINRMGFNNGGVAALVSRVRATPHRCVLGINIGKNRDTPIERAADDYLLCLEQIHPVADYIVVNISSPNTKNLRTLQHGESLRALLDALRTARARLDDVHGRRPPLLVKFSPDLPLEELVAAALAAREAGCDGVIATNTTVARAGLKDAVLAAEVGGLSGRPLCARADDAVAALRNALGADFPLIGVGGIDSAAAARQRRAAGADLIQLYTGFIYRGPALVGECAQALRV